jgi:hypothetical protein
MTDTSILFEPAAIALLVNEKALDDLRLFFESLMIWNSNPPQIFVFCTEMIKIAIRQYYKGILHIKTVLEPYSFKTRKEMEGERSKRGLPNLFYDFTQEKCDLLGWALESLSESERERGVLFCDADLFWTASIPKIPKGKTLALSPHYIRKHDEEKFGRYNAGLLWTNDFTVPTSWKKACKTSRFFEQAALEDLVKETYEDQIYLFGPQHNYGWWRLFQATQHPDQQKASWTIKRDKEEKHSGLLVDKEVLTCVHTHFKTDDFVTKEFNKWFLQQLQKVSGNQSKVKNLLRKIK